MAPEVLVRCSSKQLIDERRQFVKREQNTQQGKKAKREAELLWSFCIGHWSMPASFSMLAASAAILGDST